MTTPTPDPHGRIVPRVEREVYHNRFVTLFDDEVTFADGSSGTYVRVVAADGSPASAVLATSGGRVALVLTYRYPIADWEWAIPRGMASSTDPRITALTELWEELGANPESVESIGVIHPDSGLLSAEVSIFHATLREPKSSPRDTREIQSVLWVTWDELKDMVRRGEITDGFTLAALTLASLRGIDQSCL